MLCARARWLATRVAWVSSAECQVAHGTGHGGTHVHGTVWTVRAVGKAFFGSVHVLQQLELKPACVHCVLVRDIFILIATSSIR